MQQKQAVRSPRRHLTSPLLCALLCSAHSIGWAGSPALLDTHDVSRSISQSARVNTARHPAVDPAAPARGSAELSVSGQRSGEDWAVRLRANGQFEPLAASAEHAALDGSYAAVNGLGFVAMLGAVDRWWG